MIEVQDLTKSYGSVTAVDHVSFTVNKGEILGFLGPNGAGKTTTMRILTGYMPATSGTARIAGFDVFERFARSAPPHRLSARGSAGLSRHDGGDLSRFRRAHQERPGGTAGGARVRTRMQKTNIADKRDELIKRLSRGYKQRVGLAQALVHDPDVIILDEPTVGLDPKQIIEVRHLIKGLAGSHTIILSTHILPEVSMTCDRVVIINKGKIAAVDTPQNLTIAAQGRPENPRGSAGAGEARCRNCWRRSRAPAGCRSKRVHANGHVTATVEAAAGQGHSQPDRREDRCKRAGRFTNCAASA